MADLDAMTEEEKEAYWLGYHEGYEDCDREARLNLSQRLLAIKRLATKKAVDKDIDTFLLNMRK